MTPDEHAYTREQRLGGLGRIATAGLLWGTIPLLVRAADGAPTITVFFRMACAGLVVGGWMLATGRLKELATLPRAKWIQVSVQGLLLTLNWFLFMTALDYTNVATAELLAYCGPVFVAVFAPFVTKERFDARIVMPLALALGGIVVILAPQGLALAGRRELIGAAMAFASAITYATLLLRSKKILRGISSGALMLIEYLVAVVVLLPLVASAYLRGDGPTTAGAYAALVTLGIVQTAVAGFIFLSGLRRVRTDHAAILTYVEPAAAVAFAALFLGEPLTIATVAGGALVVTGGILVARLESREVVETVPLEAAGIDEADPGIYPSDASRREP